MYIIIYINIIHVKLSNIWIICSIYHILTIIAQCIILCLLLEFLATGLHYYILRGVSGYMGLCCVTPLHPKHLLTLKTQKQGKFLAFN